MESSVYKIVESAITA